MSYNLIAEGDLDFFELSSAATSYEPLELFPIPANPAPSESRPSEVRLPPDALGIAIPSSRVGPAAVSSLRALIQMLWDKDAAVFDLCTGERISTEEDFAALEARILG